MKHLLTFLRHGVSGTLASTVGSPSFDRRYSALKHLAFMLLFLLGSLNVWGACDFTDDFSTKNTDVSYSSCTTTDGWSATCTAVEDYTYSTITYRAFKLNGKNNNKGTITSPLFDGGCSKISFCYGQSHNDNISFKLEIKNEENAVLFTKSYSASKPGKGNFPTAGQLVDETVTGVNGKFRVVFTNTSTSTSTSNVDRASIFNICIVSAGSSNPTVSAEPNKVENVAAEGVTNQTIGLTYENIVDYMTAVTVHPNADGTGEFSGDWLTAFIDESDYATITYSISANTGGARTAYIKVYALGDDEKEATLVIPVSQVKYVAPFTGSVLEITKDNFLTGGYAQNDAGITVSGFDFAVKDVYQNSSTIQAKASSGYIYNKSVFGEIAKIEITKNGQGNNNFTVYEGTEEHPQTNSVTGEIDGTMTTYTFSSGMTYFTLKNGSTYSTVNPIKIYYNPITSAVTIDNSIENGSVEVSGATDLAQVTVGTELTLSNTPASGYKLSAYDVYKTDEPSTKVTVTNGKFTMPDYDVTVSATFEVAKVLTSIEITTPASQNTFWVGETFNYDGLVVTAHFEDAADEVVTPTSVSKPTMNVAGEQTITVSYEEGTTTKTTNYTIDVKALPTEANPGSVADMIDIWNKLSDQSDMYVRGTIYQINGFYSEKYITYWITDSYDAGAEPNHTNAFELYNGLDFGGAPFSAKEDLELGQEVVVKGNLTRFGSSAPYTLEFGKDNIIISRPKVLKSIALSGSQPTEFTQGDEFSSEGLVVTATYNYGNNAIVTPTSIIGYNMSAPGNQTVIVSYTESGVTKTATYDISVTAPDNCEHKATISKGEEVNGTFELSVSGELCLDELAENKTSTVLTAVPAEHYYLSEVTATVGTVGAISDNSCTISEINASTIITAVFAEDAKATLTFAKGEANSEEAAPGNIVDYIGETVQLPANPFTYTGHKFVGWSCDGGTTKLAAGANYTLVDDKEFVAQWDEIPTFDNSGYEWQLVTSDAQLVAGKYYVIASTAKGKVMSNTITSNVAGEIAATFTDGVIAYNAFGSSSQSADAAGVAVLQLGGEADAWKLTEVVAKDALLGATAEKKLAWGSGTTTWSISIASANANATIQNGTSSYGRFLHNVNGTRFTTYTSNTNVSMLLPQLYVWAEKVYKLRYDANGGENAPAAQAADGEGKATVTDAKPTKEDYIFKEWNTLIDGNGEAKAAGDVIDLSAGDVTLYAQWRTPNTYSISYDANGGTLIGGESEITPTSVTEGNAYTIEENVYEVEGKLFIGWKANGVTYNAGQEIYPTENMTFVAQWGDPNVTDFMLVTDVKQLKEGDKVYIVAADYNVAMGTQNDGNYRNYVEIAKQNNRVVILNATPVEFTVGKVGDNFTFNDGTGYLYASSSQKNYLNTEADLDDNGKWAITIDAEGVASIIAKGANSRKDMRYNASSGQERFSCYATSTTMKAVSIYKRPDYSRNVSGNYATICLPKAGQIIGATLYEIAYYGGASKKIFFDEIVNGEMEAGIPYIFQPAAGVEKINVYYSDNTAEDVVAGNRNGLIGFYDLNDPAARHDITEDAGYYILYNNQYWKVSGRAAYVENYRAYIQLDQIRPSEPTLAPGRRRISMSVNDTQTTTGFENAEANEAPHKVLINGELFILRGEKMYDAKGQLVK